MSLLSSPKSTRESVPTHWFNGIAWIAITLFGLLIISYGRYDHQTILVNGKKSAEQLAEHTALVAEGTLDSTRNLFSAMKFLVQPPMQEKSLDSLAIRHGLLSLQAKNDYIMDLLIVSRDGMIKSWTGSGLPPDIRGRSYFASHAEQENIDLYIGKPLLSLVHKGEWFFALSEALRDDEGDLTNVLVAIVDVSLLSQRLGSRMAIPGSSQGLLSNDGVIYTRTPDHASYVGSKVSRSHELELVKAVNYVTTSVTASQLDQKQRIISFRHLTNYPMVAVGTIPVDELFVTWNKLMGLLISFWLILSAGTIWITRRANAISRAQHELATIDDLTGIHNRRSIMTTASKIERSQAQAGSLSLLMVDIDHFKAVNDRYGHLVGDEVLRQLSETLRSQIRSTDIVGRYGGEEFLVLMPYTGPDGALLIAEKLRKSVVDNLKHSVSVTISIGVATTTEHDTTLDRTLARADKALYQAKNSGRNCVKVA